MKDNQYLYGSEAEVPEIDPMIVMRRIELLRDHLEKLLEHSYHTRDNNRVRAVLKGIKFWEEINNKDK